MATDEKADIVVNKENIAEKIASLHECSATDIDGNILDFKAEFQGKILLITNVACKCGYTKSGYDAMQELTVNFTKKYGKNDDSSTVPFKILLFPCNQFGSQEPWPEKEIKAWVTENWPQLDGQLFTKIDINGDNTHVIYQFLKTKFKGDIKWNFGSRFIIDENGTPIARIDVDSKQKQNWDQVTELLEKCVDKLCKETDNDDK